MSTADTGNTETPAPDLAQQIRDRLDGLGPGPAVEVGLPEPLTPEQREQLVQALEAEFARAPTMPLKILPPRPQFYPGFETLRDALLAVVDLEAAVRLHGLKILPLAGKDADYTHDHGDTQRIMGLAITVIAQKLGIEIPMPDLFDQARAYLAELEPDDLEAQLYTCALEHPGTAQRALLGLLQRHMPTMRHFREYTCTACGDADHKAAWPCPGRPTDRCPARHRGTPMTLHIPAALLWFLAGTGCFGLAWLVWAFATLFAFAWQAAQDAKHGAPNAVENDCSPVTETASARVQGGRRPGR